MRAGAALLLAGLAAGLAAPAGAQDRTALCERYQQQFDAMRATHADHPDFGLARRWRLLGEKYCNTGYNSAGQTVLQHAIDMLGAAPDARDAADRADDGAGRTYRTY